MATEIKTKTVEAFDPWKTPRETWQHVTLPDEDATGTKFPSIWLNKTEFRAGQDYDLPVAVADHLKDRIKVYNKSVVRLFSPSRDHVAERAVAVGTTSAMAPSYIDASQVKTA